MTSRSPIPVARGSGAVLAAIGGVVLLDDDLSVLGVVAVVTVAVGMWLLSIGATATQLVTAIGRGADDRRLHRQRQPGGPSLRHHLSVRRVRGDRRRVVRLRRRHRTTAPPAGRRQRADWRQWTITGAMAVAAYVLVMIAVRRAPVGYVAVLRESSVLLAAFLGNRYLDETRRPPAHGSGGCHPQRTRPPRRRPLTEPARNEVGQLASLRPARSGSCSTVGALVSDEPIRRPRPALRRGRGGRGGSRRGR